MTYEGFGAFLLGPIEFHSASGLSVNFLLKPATRTGTCAETGRASLIIAAEGSDCLCEVGVKSARPKLPAPSLI